MNIREAKVAPDAPMKLSNNTATPNDFFTLELFNNPRHTPKAPIIIKISMAFLEPKNPE
ncbi:hypothetical protein IMCC1989_1763 [gamma proteobacterium IMCC1989]|nr:hypothetical protein IMCC1989_1763 [gamma proteobacterium IMCC1989]